MNQTADRAICPQCRNDASYDATYHLFVSICGHELCNRCVEDQFRARTVLVCLTPLCGTQLQRSQFERKMFASGLVHRDVKVHARLAKVYDLTAGHFGHDIKGYNAYLEFVEDTAFNLVNRVAEKLTDERVKEDERARAVNKFLFHDQLIRRHGTATHQHQPMDHLAPLGPSLASPVAARGSRIDWPPRRSTRYPSAAAWAGPIPPPTPQLIGSGCAPGMVANECDARLLPRAVARAGGYDLMSSVQRALGCAYDHLFSF